MPGVDLNLDLPSLSDPLATIVAKFITALSVVEDDLAADVTPSEIDINTSLSMNGSALVNTGSVQFVAGNAPTSAGSMWYEDDEFWVQDATGAVRLTVDGAIDASSIGGITSLASPAAVTWDLASSQFRFTADSGVFADLSADDLVLNSASGSVRFSVADAITTAREFNIVDLPASGVSALVYDAASSSLKSSENTRITNALKATTLDVSGASTLTGNVTVGGLTSVAGGLVHPVWEQALPTHNGDRFAGVNKDTTNFTTSVLSVSRTVGTSNNSSLQWMQHIPLRVGERIKTLGATVSKTTAGAPNFTISLVSLSGGNVFTTLDFANLAASGVSALLLTLGTPAEFATDTQYFFQFDFPALSSVGYFSRPFFTYDNVVG